MAHMSGLAAEPATRGPGRPIAADDELVALAKRDRAAFGPLYDRYADLVYRYCLRRLGNRETAEDATGQTFVKVLAALPTYRDDGPSFRSWLFAIAHNVLVDVERGRRPVEGLDAADTVADESAGPRRRRWPRRRGGTCARSWTRWRPTNGGCSSSAWLG